MAIKNETAQKKDYLGNSKQENGRFIQKYRMNLKHRQCVSVVLRCEVFVLIFVAW